MKNIFLLLIVVIAVTKSYSQNNDSSVIIKLLETESATWRSGDVKAHANCWSIKPYSRILVSTTDGKTFDVPPSLMLNPNPNNFGKGGFAVISNIKLNVSGSNAWVSHNEVSTATDGAKTYSYEIRILEKINDQWKLVGQSIHLYKPKE